MALRDIFSRKNKKAEVTQQAVVTKKKKPVAPAPSMGSRRGNGSSSDSDFDVVDAIIISDVIGDIAGSVGKFSPDKFKGMGGDFGGGGSSGSWGDPVAKIAETGSSGNFESNGGSNIICSIFNAVGKGIGHVIGGIADALSNIDIDFDD